MSFPNNIFKVVKKKDVDEIMHENQHRIVAIFVVPAHSVKNDQMKHYWLQLAKKNTDTLFLYIEKATFQDTSQTFFKQLYKNGTNPELPSFFFTYKQKQYINLSGFNPTLIVKEFYDLKKYIELLKENTQSKFSVHEIIESIKKDIPETIEPKMDTRDNVDVHANANVNANVNVNDDDDDDVSGNYNAEENDEDEQAKILEKLKKQIQDEPEIQEK